MTAGEHGARLEQLAVALEGDGAQQIIDEVAVEAQRATDREVVRDLGSDRKFENWAPPLLTALKPIGTGGVVLTPLPGSGGPFTVANSGRQSGKHGRTRGMGTVDRSVAAMERTAADVAERGNKRLLAKYLAVD